MGELKIPGPLLDALLNIANDYMQEEEFQDILKTDWSDREKAGPAWRKLNLCLQKVSKSPFPGPRETMDKLQSMLAPYQLKFDGVRISKRESYL